MKLITLTFFTYIRSVLLYLLFTLPAAVMPRIYLVSVLASFVLGMAAWLVFMMLSVIIRFIKASMATVYVLLHASVAIAVIIAYSILLGYAIEGMHFWDLQPFSLFPAAAIAAGWISLYINRAKLKRYFKPARNVKTEGFSLHPSKHFLN